MSGKVSWTELKPANAPLARSSHGVSIVGDTLYMFGGEHNARVPVNDTLYALDLSRKDSAWQEIKTSGNPPLPRFGHAQAVIGSCIYIFGGRMGTAIDEKLLNDFYMFDTKTCKWTEVEFKGSAPSPRSFHQMVADDGCLYVFGGCPAEGRLADLYRFELSSATWSQLETSSMDGRGGASVAMMQDKSALCVLGGFAGREMKDIHMFDLQTLKWSVSSKELKKACSVAVCVTAGNRVVLFGGEIEPSAKGHAGAGNFSEELAAYDENLEEKIRNGEGAPARGWSAGDVWRNNTVVIVGGLAGDDENPTRLMDVWCAKIN